MGQTKQTQQNRLTPTPKALQKALEQSAKQAQRIADAFGVVVPTTKSKIHKKKNSNQAVESISAQAVKLPPAERIAVVERILDSLDQPDAAVDVLWVQEASDRLAAYRRGEISAMVLSDVIVKYQINTTLP